MAIDRIPEGFQQTEVGVIPGDWKIKLLSEIAHFENGKAHEQSIDEHGEYIVVNSKFISTEGNIKKHSKRNISPLKKGDITIVMSDIPNGKALAKCFLVDKNHKYTLNQRIGGITAKEDTDNKYLFYKLDRNKFYLAFDSGAGQTNLKKQEILDCPVALPPTLAEQNAIAAALSDMDALVEGLERLIGKKRAVKQGAMQALLRPKEPWVEKPLKMLTNYIASGKSDTNPTKGTYPIYGSTGIIGSSLDYDYSGRKILIARVGANAGKVNKVDGNYCVSDNTLIVDITDNVDLDFIYHYLINLDLNKIIFGSGQPLITGGQLKELLIFLPPNKTEQTAIARALSDMDAEIGQLEAQLAKYRRVKEGMMQELLTGKKRLV